MILAALIATITRGVVTGIPYSIAGLRSAFRVVIDAKTRAEPAYKRRVAQCERLTRSTRSEGFPFHCKNGNFSHLLVDYLYILWLNWWGSAAIAERSTRDLVRIHLPSASLCPRGSRISNACEL